MPLAQRYNDLLIFNNNFCVDNGLAAQKVQTGLVVFLARVICLTAQKIENLQMACHLVWCFVQDWARH